MPPRLKTLVLVAFVFLFLYLVAPFARSKDASQQVADLLKGVGAEGVVKGWTGQSPQQGSAVSESPKEENKEDGKPAGDASPPVSAPAAAVPEAGKKEDASSPVAEPEKPTEELSLQDQFMKAYDALGVERSSGKIYGSSLKKLTGAGKHAAGAATTALKPTDSWTAYNDAPPYVYNPYPDYNSTAWKASNKGTYVPCAGPMGEVKDVLVFSGQPESFGEPALGSYSVLDIDNNLCFERETRYSSYGYKEDNGTKIVPENYDDAYWGALQDFCFQKNADRFVKLEQMPVVTEGASATAHNARGLIETRDQKPATRTAVLIRAYSGHKYSENDKMNIRAMISELALKSGGEYQVFLLVQVKNNLNMHKGEEIALQLYIPEEFWDMTEFWNEARMKEIYTAIPGEVNNVHQSQWLPVQKFAQEHPQFDYYWNLELDTRYTGHHYNLFEKIASFARAQPRKGLWERNERYYIPSIHGDYDTKFRKTVETAAGPDTVWGAPQSKSTPVGPKPPTDAVQDDYKWGVGEDADYISLAPIFNPVDTDWVGRNDVWGWDSDTPRRATIGTQSRCSKKLLDTMNEENMKGNHVSSEMTPQTVALLHGMKAVYAPLPIFFDRQWEGAQLEKYFNPCPKGQSGSCGDSPYGWGKEGRFNGSTWYYRAVPPMRLHNNWLGWEDSGIGGPEWEKQHGRPCLPPILMHPVKDVVKPPPGHFSTSELPY